MYKHFQEDIFQGDANKTELAWELFLSFECFLHNHIEIKEVSIHGSHFQEVVTVIQFFGLGCSFKCECVVCEDLDRRKNDELIKKIKRKEQKQKRKECVDVEH